MGRPYNREGARVSGANPTEQGLKRQGTGGFARRRLRVSGANPTEQGLKQDSGLNVGY